MKVRGHVFGLTRLSALSLMLALPSYVLNNVVVLFLLDYLDIKGVGNIGVVWTGDAVGFAGGVAMAYFVWNKSARIRRWSGSNEKTVCPKCGSDLTSNSAKESE